MFVPRQKVYIICYCADLTYISGYMPSFRHTFSIISQLFGFMYYGKKYILDIVPGIIHKQGLGTPPPDLIFGRK